MQAGEGAERREVAEPGPGMHDQVGRWPSGATGSQSEVAKLPARRVLGAADREATGGAQELERKTTVRQSGGHSEKDRSEVLPYLFNNT